MTTKLRAFLRALWIQLKPMHFIFLGAILAAIGSISSPFVFTIPIGDLGFYKFSLNPLTLLGAIVVSFATLYQNWKSSLKTNNILDNTKLQLEKLESLTTKNEQLAEQLNDAAQHIVLNITGGDGYASVLPVVNSDLGNVTLAIENKGNYPLRNLSVRIFNATDYNKAKALDEKVDVLSKRFNLYVEEPVIGTRMAVMLKIENLKILPGVTNWNIFSTSLSSSTVQKLIISRISGEIKTATKIYSADPKREILFESVSDGFPDEYLNLL
ncbi:hypothetical protein [Pedobacter miscanthi]|uniref:hypothetical protein n=1 Tax=Pedobacter miscanthi TaxID=2259170 RepID=UPI00292D122B|nr:hypothetical protein [Pedobacter miscanthi]